MAFREIDNVPRPWQTDYNKFYETFQRVDCHHFADVLYDRMGSYTNMLAWHESRVKFCVYNFLGDTEQAKKLMDCLRKERKKHENDPEIVELKKEVGDAAIPDSCCYKKYKPDDYGDTYDEDNPLQDRYCKVAAKYCKTELNTWEDIRIWAFGQSIDVNKLIRAPKIVEIISNILLKYNKQRKLSMTMTDDSIANSVASGNENGNDNGSVKTQLSASNNDNLENKNQTEFETQSIDSINSNDIDFYKVLRQFIKISDSENSDETETKNEETSKYDKKRKTKKDRKEKSKQKLKQKSKSKGNRMTVQDTIYENEAIMYQSDITKFITFMSQLRDTSTELGILYTTCINQLRQDMINDSKNGNDQRFSDKQSSANSTLLNDNSLLGMPMPLSRGQSLESNVSNTSTNFSKENNKHDSEYFAGMNSYNNNDYMLLLLFDEWLNFLEKEMKNNDNNNNVNNNNNGNSILCDLGIYMKNNDYNNKNIKIAIGWCFIFEHFNTGVMKTAYKDMTVCQDFVYYARYRNSSGNNFKELIDKYHQKMHQKWGDYIMIENDHYAPMPDKLKYDDIRNAFNARKVPMGLQLTYYVRYNGDFWYKVSLFAIRNWLQWFGNNVLNNILDNNIQVTEIPKYEDYQAIIDAYNQVYGNKNQ